TWSSQGIEAYGILHVRDSRLRSPRRPLRTRRMRSESSRPPLLRGVRALASPRETQGVADVMIEAQGRFNKVVILLIEHDPRSIHRCPADVPAFKITATASPTTSRIAVLIG